mmetsp:Transcript_14079/g.24764  ORF Transcript_14079/g.24764 Transcript_14079/m.24764 type:complete len:113 (-) Transcript_14079:1074-1412(-)
MPAWRRACSSFDGLRLCTDASEVRGESARELGRVADDAGDVSRDDAEESALRQFLDLDLDGSGPSRSVSQAFSLGLRTGASRVLPELLEPASRGVTEDPRDVSRDDETVEGL